MQWLYALRQTCRSHARKMWEEIQVFLPEQRWQKYLAAHSCVLKKLCLELFTVKGNDGRRLRVTEFRQRHSTELLFQRKGEALTFQFCWVQGLKGIQEEDGGDRWTVEAASHVICQWSDDCLAFHTAKCLLIHHRYLLRETLIKT